MRAGQVCLRVWGLSGCCWVRAKSAEWSWPPLSVMKDKFTPSYLPHPSSTANLILFTLTPPPPLHTQVQVTVTNLSGYPLLVEPLPATPTPSATGLTMTPIAEVPSGDVSSATSLTTISTATPAAAAPSTAPGVAGIMSGGSLRAAGAGGGVPVRLEVAPGTFTGGVGGEEVGVSTSSSFLPPSSASNLLQDSAGSNLTGGRRVGWACVRGARVAGGWGACSVIRKGCVENRNSVSGCIHHTVEGQDGIRNRT